MDDLTFDNLFDNVKIGINCPECNGEFNISITQVDLTVQCPHCRATVHIEDSDDSFEESKSDIDDALSKLSDSLDSFNF